MELESERLGVTNQNQIDLLLALQAQADPPPAYPETHKHKKSSNTTRIHTAIPWPHSQAHPHAPVSHHEDALRSSSLGPLTQRKFKPERVPTFFKSSLNKRTFLPVISLVLTINSYKAGAAGEGKTP